MPNGGASRASIGERTLKTLFNTEVLRMQQLVFKVLFKLIPSLPSYSLKKAMSKTRFIVPDILVGKPLLLQLPGYRQLLTREL